MTEPTDVIFTSRMVKSCRDAHPIAMPARVFARQPTLGAPSCGVCGEPCYPEIRRSPASEEHDQGQMRVNVCGPCQRWRYLELDLIAAKRAGLVQP